uniref:Uncharacterized protein n=2 Tax=Culex quinquefasciatus TaxID=7176 RepID=A0A1S4JJI5_CULQU
MISREVECVILSGRWVGESGTGGRRTERGAGSRLSLFGLQRGVICLLLLSLANGRQRGGGMVNQIGSANMALPQERPSSSEQTTTSGTGQFHCRRAHRINRWAFRTDRLPSAQIFGERSTVLRQTCFLFHLFLIVSSWFRDVPEFVTHTLSTGKQGTQQKITNHLLRADETEPNRKIICRLVAFRRGDPEKKQVRKEDR